MLYEVITCAVDCGLAINPDVIRAQMEGGIGFALTAALHSEITLDDGVVQQSNFRITSYNVCYTKLLRYGTGLLNGPTVSGSMYHTGRIGITTPYAV